MRAMIGALLLTLALGGCAHFRPPSQQSGMAGSSELAYLVQLTEADEARLDRMSRAFNPPIDVTLNPGQALRHALWQGTSGHSGHDPDAARQSLRDLLDRGDVLTIQQRQLARVYLADLERRARLQRRNEDLSDANRELREQIEALTNLESEMGGDSGSGE